MVISLYFTGTSFTNIRADHPHWFLMNSRCGALRNAQVVTEYSDFTYTICSLALVPATISFVAPVICTIKPPLHRVTLKSFTRRQLNQGRKLTLICNADKVSPWGGVDSGNVRLTVGGTFVSIKLGIHNNTRTGDELRMDDNADPVNRSIGGFVSPGDHNEY